MRLAGLLAAPVVAVLAAGPVPGPPAPDATGSPPGTLLFSFADPRIAESSGLATDPSNDSILWTHNDSGDASRVFAVGPAGQTLAVVVLPGTAVDVEDIAAGPGPAGPSLYLADIGDNAAHRTSVVVRRSPVAGPGAAGGSLQARLTQTQTLTYEDRPHDAEALLVHPRTGQELVVTKDLLGAGVYEAPADFRDGVLHLRGTVTTRLTGTPGGPAIGPAAQLLVTGGAVSADGRRVALRTYTDAYLYAVPGQDLVAALRGTPVVLPLPQTRQGEGLTWTRDGTALLTSSEGKGAPVYRVPVPPLPGAPRPSAPPLGGQEMGSHRNTHYVVTYVTVALVAAGVIVGLTRTVRRRGRPRAASRPPGAP